jgi:hypothetical protein
MSDWFEGFQEADDTSSLPEDADSPSELALQDVPGRRKRHDGRRAIVGGIAGVVMLAAPLVLANTIIDDGNDDGPTDETSANKLITERKLDTGAEQIDEAQLLNLKARVTTTTAPPTTTTTAPPTTTTTAPPPPPPTTAPPTTAPPMTTPPVNIQPGSGQLGDPNLDASWDKLAQCESGGNWAINTGNGYYGGIQFSLSTWQGLGGTGLPSDHPREVQIAMGKKLWQTSGWAAWPACTRSFGWR